MLARLTLLPLLGAVLALAAGCGGGSGAGAVTQEVPENAVAAVAGTPVLRSDYDCLLKQAEAAYEAKSTEFPKAGTPEYEGLKAQAVDFLVQRVEFAKESAVLKIAVTDEEVAKRLDEYKQQFFQGDEQAYQDELEKAGISEPCALQQLRAQLVSEKLFADVTKAETVTDEEIQTYYDESKDRFTTPESRDVAHILVKTKDEADKLYQEVQDGGDFAKLAKEHSVDEASAKDGGKLTDQKGTFVPEFEAAAFALKTGEVSEPVETTYGWHIIKALADAVPEKVVPLAEAKDSIRAQLLQETQNKAMSRWVTQIRQTYTARIAYAVGFEPPKPTSTLPADTGP